MNHPSKDATTTTTTTDTIRERHLTIIQGLIPLDEHSRRNSAAFLCTCSEAPINSTGLGIFAHCES